MPKSRRVVYICSHDLHNWDWLAFNCARRSWGKHSVAFLYKNNRLSKRVYRYGLSIYEKLYYRIFQRKHIVFINAAEGNTVNRCVDFLTKKDNRSLVIFAHRDKLEHNSGIYHIVTQTNPEIVTVKIKSDKDSRLEHFSTKEQRKEQVKNGEITLNFEMLKEKVTTRDKFNTMLHKALYGEAKN
jgi:hypothetical protein